MENFTPIAALSGGALIGLSAALLWLAKGRIAGISGITAGVLMAPLAYGQGWRAAFMAGLLLAPVLYWLAGGPMPAIEIADLSMPVLILAGLLVGFGTRLGSGCTSGHGICGLARFSKRSVVATLVFMASAIITVFVTRHMIGM